MKKFAFCLGLLLMTSLTHAKELVATIGGKAVTFQSNVINREIDVKDKQGGDRRSALGCSLLYYGHLAANEIDKASLLTTDPAKSRSQWEQYRERLGMADFREAMNEYFTNKTVVVAEIVKGSIHMLVVNSPGNGMAAQMYARKGDEFAVEESLHSDDAKLLGKVFGMIRAGTVKPD